MNFLTIYKYQLNFAFELNILNIIFSNFLKFIFHSLRALDRITNMNELTPHVGGAVTWHVVTGFVTLVQGIELLERFFEILKIHVLRIKNRSSQWKLHTHKLKQSDNSAKLHCRKCETRTLKIVPMIDKSTYNEAHICYNIVILRPT